MTSGGYAKNRETLQRKETPVPWWCAIIAAHALKEIKSFGLKSVYHVHAGSYPQKTDTSIGNERYGFKRGF